MTHQIGYKALHPTAYSLLFLAPFRAVSPDRQVASECVTLNRTKEQMKFILTILLIFLFSCACYAQISRCAQISI
jgi:hypothetical protein